MPEVVEIIALGAPPQTPGVFNPNYAARRPFIDNQQLISRNFSISPGNSDASVSVSFLFRGCSGISSNANRG